MHVSCQFSIYPLGVDHLSTAIDAALKAIGRHGLEVEVGSMSSTITGPREAVFTALADGFAAAASGHCVLVATISNACPQPPTEGGGREGEGSPG